MNIKLLLLLPLTIIPLFGFSQKQEISDWQRIHPNVIFIERNDFTPEFESRLTALNQEFIVYQDEILIDEINAYDTKASEKSIFSEVKNNGDAQLIKDWLSQNQGIKIIPRSYYDSTSDTERGVLLNNDALILIGEKITSTDIQNYDAIH